MGEGMLPPGTLRISPLARCGCPPKPPAFRSPALPSNRGWTRFDPPCRTGSQAGGQ